jgi:hypothetical protein
MQAVDTDFWKYVKISIFSYSRVYTKTDFWKNWFSNSSISKKLVKTGFRIFAKNVIKGKKYLHLF